MRARTPEQPTTNHARLQLFGKANKGLYMLPPIRDALELHAIRANYQAKIVLQADKEHLGVPPQLVSMVRKKDSESLTAVWTISLYITCLRETGERITKNNSY